MITIILTVKRESKQGRLYDNPNRERKHNIFINIHVKTMTNKRQLRDRGICMYTPGNKSLTRNRCG